MRTWCTASVVVNSAMPGNAECTFWDEAQDFADPSDPTGRGENRTVQRAVNRGYTRLVCPMSHA